MHKKFYATSLRNVPNHFILHAGTNVLYAGKTAESIANAIIELATSLKNDQPDVKKSNIILRTDNTNLNEKRYLVNRILAEMRKEETYILLIITEKYVASS